MIKGLQALKEYRSQQQGVNVYADEYLDIIEKELKDYQEIREIAKRYNWDDITSKIFNVETDEKYRHLFNSAIVNIQEDYLKYKKALEIIRNKDVDTRDLFVVFDWFGRGEEELALNDYNSRHKTDEEYNNITLTLEEFNLLKEVLL